MARPRQARSIRPVTLTRLRAARLRCGLTQADVRALTAIPVSILSRAERGLSVPSSDDLLKLARLFNEDAATLLVDVALVAS